MHASYAETNPNPNPKDTCMVTHIVNIPYTIHTPFPADNAVISVRIYRCPDIKSLSRYNYSL